MESIIGVDVGATSVGVGKVQKNRVCKHLNFDISARGEKNQILNEIILALEKVFEPGVVGIGVGVPSLVDVEKGIVYNVQNIPSWEKVNLKEILENRFQRPVYVNNDANCFAVGEKYFGKGKKYRNLAGVTLGTGLGTGIIIENRLYSGPNCGAGEFGVVPYKDHILEYYSSGQFFFNQYGITGDLVYKKAVLNDKDSLAMFRQFGHHLGEAVKIILLAFDPEAVIFGGSVTKSFHFFEKAMWESIRTFPYKHALDGLVIEVSDHPQIAILGAAALYLDAKPSLNYS